MSFVEVIITDDKKIETVIKAYLKYVYADKGGSKFILTDRGGEYSVKQCLTLQISWASQNIYLTLLT